jgi:galactofuranose transport system permease protein
MTIRLARKHIPLAATAFVCMALYAAASLRYTGFFSLPVLINFFADNSFLGITAIGMTFVILSGGIDLSVGAVIGLTSILTAALVEKGHMHPGVVLPLVLALGAVFGTTMGFLISRFGLPPFLVTLAGMFLARGLGLVTSLESLSISHPFFVQVSGMGIRLGESASVPITAILLLVVFAVALYVAHLTPFGRNVYAIGGKEEAALLMGLPVARTKMAIYAMSGFCSALAGVVYTIYSSSGNANAGTGLELDAIAAVVIGGTLLSGGVGYVAGTLIGVLIFGIIQTGITFQGTLSSWWTKIAIGLLLLVFILIQRLLARKSGAQ